MGDTDRAYSPHTAQPARRCRRYSSHPRRWIAELLLGRAGALEQRVERLVPAGETAFAPIPRKTIEHIAPYEQPGPVRVVEFHHRLPRAHGQPERGLLVPRNA